MFHIPMNTQVESQPGLPANAPEATPERGSARAVKAHARIAHTPQNRIFSLPPRLPLTLPGEQRLQTARFAVLFVCVRSSLLSHHRTALFCMPLAPPPATHHCVLLPSCQLPLFASARQKSVVCANASRGKLVIRKTSASKANATTRLPAGCRQDVESASGHTLPVGVLDNGEVGSVRT